MSRFTTLVLGHQVGIGNWEVSCLRCKKEIGVMSHQVMMEAVWRTAHRGGVMCPDCRSRSCKACGAELEQRDLAAATKNCWLCELDLTESRACLVPHISNQEPKSIDFCGKCRTVMIPFGICEVCKARDESNQAEMAGLNVK